MRGVLSGWFFFSSRRRHTRWTGDWSSDVCSSDLRERSESDPAEPADATEDAARRAERREQDDRPAVDQAPPRDRDQAALDAPAPETAAAMTVVVRTAIRVV